MTISVVIPTIGRESLHRAVQSVLDQTEPVIEILLVADTDAPLSHPADGRIRLLRNNARLGPSVTRQRGIEAAKGSVIALLDDDDEWYPDKLRRQLAAATEVGPNWIASCRMVAIGSGSRRRVWPRRLIAPDEDAADYLFRFTDPRHGGRTLQTSTLLFPAQLARAVPWDAHAEAIHDEPSWLLAVAQAFPDLRVIQLPEVLVTYNAATPSVSRQTTDLTDRYIDWGRRYLADESPRVRGDYQCTSPVSAAVAAGSVASIGRAVRAGLRDGRPGPAALTFAALSAVRVLLRRATNAVRR